MTSQHIGRRRTGAPGRTGLAVMTTVATAVSATVVAVPAHAAPEGSGVVINEVYGGGGNSGAVFDRDFVELYNPTDAPVSVEGWTVDQMSAKGNTGNTFTLSGEVPAGGHLLIGGAGGTGGGAPLPQVDVVAAVNFGARQATAKLTDDSGATVDLVGWGAAAKAENTPAAATDNTTSVQRVREGGDTDDNSADFTVAAPTPTNSAGQTAPADGGPDGAGPNPGTGDDGNDDGDNGGDNDRPGAARKVTAAEVQGTGASTPLDGETVTVDGVVTAAYPEGGFRGFYLQDPGTGGEPQAPGQASTGLFVYTGDSAETPQVGDSVQVTGTAGEHFGLTQISDAHVAELSEKLDAVRPVELPRLPVGDAAREALEGMLVLPTGAVTVTGNYELNQYGTIQLAPGTQPLRQPTDVAEPDTDPDSPVPLLARRQVDEMITLDDGRSRNYLRGDQDTPLPWISRDGGATIKSVRTGDAVDFTSPVVLDYRFDTWSLQPTGPVTGATSAAELPVDWADSRPAALGAVDKVAGEYSIASFNVLNYFTSLGKDHGCDAYTDRAGKPVAARGCQVRGAFDEAAFTDQENKIVAAINRLDVDVLGLEEIENTAAVTGSPERRDEALARLVDALNAAGGNWAFVPSPKQTGTAEDVIRVGFIYNPDTVEPVGDSVIFDDDAFTGTARQPLAQEFRPAGAGADAESFVGVVNHFKSKGSVTRGDADSGDGQGNNPNVRARQSEALLAHLDKQDRWRDLPVFVLGDLNSYSRERAVAVLEHGGFTNIAAEYDAGATYQFDERLGSLDHALGNAAAMARVVDAKVWDINADEPLAFEYSRRNYNAVDFYQDDPDNIVFRASDHDPVKVGFDLTGAPGDDPTTGGTDDEAGGEDGNDDGSDEQGSSARPGSSAAEVALGVLGALAALLGLAGIVSWALQFAPAELSAQLDELLGR